MIVISRGLVRIRGRSFCAREEVVGTRPEKTVGNKVACGCASLHGKRGLISKLNRSVSPRNCQTHPTPIS
eukprot:31305-Pelagococcus_subviridis.AAC.8